MNKIYFENKVLDNSNLPISLKDRFFLVFYPALLIVAHWFIFAPSNIFLGNASIFEFRLVDLLTYCLIPFSTLLILILLVGISFPKKHISLYISILFALGILVWMQGNILKWDYGLMNGTTIDWSEYLWQGKVDLLLWVAIIFIAIYFRNKVVKISSITCVTMLLLQFIVLIPGFSSTPKVWASIESDAKTNLFPKNITKYSSSFNIIHILFDSLQTEVATEIIKEKKMESDLDGFVLFRENMSAYARTWPSIPSAFSGEIYDGRETISNQIANSLRKPFYSDLYQNGYKVNFIEDKFKPITPVSNYHYIKRKYGSTKENKIMETAFLIDISLFQYSPQFIKKILYDNQNWTIIPSIRTFLGDMKIAGYFYHKDFFETYTTNLSIGDSKPAYHYMHFYPPHEPFVTLEDCSYSDKVLARERKTYKVESGCVLDQLNVFLKKLKKLGIYDSSLIIVHSDHGERYEPISMVDTPPENAEDSLSLDIAGSLAFLAVKPPGKKGKLEYSDALTMITDLPATVMKFANIPNRFKGTNVFDINPSIKKRNRSHLLFNNAIGKVVKGDKKYFELFYNVSGSAYSYDSWKKTILVENLLKTHYYKWGTPINFGFGNWEPYDNGGWGFPQEIWTNFGKNASLKIPIDRANIPKIVNLRIVMAVSEEEKKGLQILKARVNGIGVGKWEVRKNNYYSKLIVNIPIKLISSNDNIDISFEYTGERGARMKLISFGD